MRDGGLNNPIFSFACPILFFIILLLLHPLKMQSWITRS